MAPTPKKEPSSGSNTVGLKVDMSGVGHERHSLDLSQAGAPGLRLDQGNRLVFGLEPFRPFRSVEPGHGGLEIMPHLGACFLGVVAQQIGGMEGRHDRVAFVARLVLAPDSP